MGLPFLATREGARCVRSRIRWANKRSQKTATSPQSRRVRQETQRLRSCEKIAALPPDVRKGSEAVKSSKATDYHGFARIKTNNLSVPIRGLSAAWFNSFTACPLGEPGAGRHTVSPRRYAAANGALLHLLRLTHGFAVGLEFLHFSPLPKGPQGRGLESLISICSSRQAMLVSAHSWLNFPLCLCVSAVNRSRGIA